MILSLHSFQSGIVVSEMGNLMATYDVTVSHWLIYTRENLRPTQANLGVISS